MVGMIIGIVDSNRRRDMEIAEIEKTTREEIKRIDEYYASEKKKLQEHHEKVMKKLEDPNLTVDELFEMFKSEKI